MSVADFLKEQSRNPKRASNPKRANDGAPAPVSPSTDWHGIRTEAAAHGAGLLGLLLWQDARLVAAGQHESSPYMLAMMMKFYASAKRWLVLCAGRGSGKSSFLTRVSVVEALFTPRKIPGGERWLWIFISASRADARARLVMVQEILSSAYGIQTDITYPDGVPTLALDDANGNKIAFVSLASTIAGVSGPSTIGVLVDEEAKLRDRVTNANPSTEILRSLRATFRTREGIHGFRCSSAWETSGSFHEQVTVGSDDLHHVAEIGHENIAHVRATYARLAAIEADPDKGLAIRGAASSLTPESRTIPTWLCNPSQTPEATRREEPDVTIWLREIGGFAAVEASRDVCPMCAVRHCWQCHRPTCVCQALDRVAGPPMRDVLYTSGARTPNPLLASHFPGFHALRRPPGVGGF